MLAEQLNNEVWATLGVSSIHGVGVIAIRDIPQGTPFLLGQDDRTFHEITDEEFLRIEKPIQDIMLGREQFAETICFHHPNSLAHLQNFMNHSNDPNTDGHVTLRAILKGEELTEDYFEIVNADLHPFTTEHYLTNNIT